jgi:hypothetical protein
VYEISERYYSNFANRKMSKIFKDHVRDVMN